MNKKIVAVRFLQVIIILLGLWALEYVYFLVPSYLVAALRSFRDQYPYLKVLLSLDYGRFLGRFIRLIFVLALYAALVRWSPLKTRLKELLSFPHQKKVMLFALVLPVFFVLLEWGFAWKFGWITQVEVQHRWLFSVFFYGLIMLWTAITEELLSRGISIVMLENVVGSYGAVGIQALYFGLAHWYGTGELLYGISTTIMGVLLGLTVLRTRSLWPAIGLHWLWNTTETVMYSQGIVHFVITNHYWLGSRTTPDEQGLFSAISMVVMFIMWLVFSQGLKETKQHS